MESTENELAQVLLRRLESTPNTSRLLVGIAGVPASGKSSLARLLIDKINEHRPEEIAILVGLDGWHLTRAQLDAMPDPKFAHDRRGAHWTFDGASYVTFARLLRQDITASTLVITAPSFDHALKDPVPHAVSIHPHHRIVVIEGLYTFLAIDPWEEAAKLLDERWFIKVDLTEASRRLVKRHVLTGVAKDREEAIWRSNENDEPNGKFIADNLHNPTRIILSVDDPKYADLCEDLP
ncbi:P-loop containing nucleoside triphosphate hydrolase protein [Hygrophoropsis aurantiaca]|uniref:P-loop containing nucleoside triphosphate hydrolase protein n=1 Tax=Hygrophoropsis aurantiaca TaxID=72124 RepID=A0ACB8A6E9_9AGAM|nr:P-loop containing nucleoside triphosphate hydrolase protein [Hygrophoropsis aurantiaca]